MGSVFTPTLLFTVLILPFAAANGKTVVVVFSVLNP